MRIKCADSLFEFHLTFLCARVEVLTEQDYKKLGKVISYLKETVDLSLVVGADNSGRLTWNIDASFAVHSDWC